MGKATSGYQRFFAELKRRQVFRVMAVYGVVGFIVLQVVDLLVPALLLPEWTYRFVAVLLFVGFPVAIVLAWAFEQTPAGIQRTGPADAAEIDAIVSAPASRRWPAGMLALAGVALLFGGWWLGQRGTPGADVAGDGPVAAEPGAEPELRLALAAEEREALPTIAVLPFADMSPEGDQEYFSDGISEELLNALVKLRDLKIVSRTSAFAYRDGTKDIREIGAELGADYIVEGSVRKAGDRLRITAQLVETESDVHLWSEQYDRQLDDVFAIQTEIAEAIADELRVPLGLDEGERLVSPTEDLEAYDLYLAGRARMRERGESVAEAVTLFEAAIARDSTWAPAWAGLAESRALIPYYGPEDYDEDAWREDLADAERAAERALELDPRNASALVALGNVHRDRGEIAAAEEAYVRALRLDPENVEAHHQYAEYFSYIGQMDEAYRLAMRALSLDRSPIRLNIAGLMATYNERYAEAIELIDEGIRADPDNRLRALRNNKLQTLAQAGNWQAVRAYGRQVVTERAPVDLAEFDGVWPPGAPLSLDIADAVAAAGDPFWAADMYLALGERERALAALESGIDELREEWWSSESWFWGGRGWFMPNYDPIRDEPGFRAILEEFGVADFELQRLPPDAE